MHPFQIFVGSPSTLFEGCLNSPEVHVEKGKDPSQLQRNPMRDREIAVRKLPQQISFSRVRAEDFHVFRKDPSD